MNIQAIMSRPAVTCLVTDTLDVPARLMWEHDCGAVPVVDDGECVVGMLTDRDICMAGYTQGRPLHAIAVSRVMARRVFSCHAGHSLTAAGRLMSDKQIRRVPVVDEYNRPLGVVSVNDIARFAVSSCDESELDSEVTRTLAAICQPRRTSEESEESEDSEESPAPQPARVARAALM